MCFSLLSDRRFLFCFSKSGQLLSNLPITFEAREQWLGCCLKMGQSPRYKLALIVLAVRFRARFQHSLLWIITVWLTLHIPVKSSCKCQRKRAGAPWLKHPDGLQVCSGTSWRHCLHLFSFAHSPWVVKRFVMTQLHSSDVGGRVEILCYGSLC